MASDGQHMKKSSTCSSDSACGRGLWPVFAALVGCAASARTVLVPPLGAPAWLDTEVSTNVVLHASRSDTSVFDLRVQFDGTPTNDLEVAFGRDANANGVLDADEAETVYGWRGGRYFVENARAWTRIETEAATNALCGVFHVRVENDSAVVPRRFSATCGGEDAFAELSARPVPPWLFRREWDVARVTRRGVEVPSEWVRLDADYQSFTIRLR